ALLEARSTNLSSNTAVLLDPANDVWNVNGVYLKGLLLVNFALAANASVTIGAVNQSSPPSPTETDLWLGGGVNVVDVFAGLTSLHRLFVDGTRGYTGIDTVVLHAATPAGGSEPQ